MMLKYPDSGDARYRRAEGERSMGSALHITNMISKGKTRIGLFGYWLKRCLALAGPEVRRERDSTRDMGSCCPNEPHIIFRGPVVVQNKLHR